MLFTPDMQKRYDTEIYHLLPPNILIIFLYFLTNTILVSNHKFVSCFTQIYMG